MHVILVCENPMEYKVPQVTLNTTGLWMVMMCQCWLISCNNHYGVCGMSIVGKSRVKGQEARVSQLSIL